MYAPDEVNEKQQDYENASKRDITGQATAGYGAIGNSAMPKTCEPCRASLNERVSSQLNRAIGEARHAEQLRELQYLLRKNPDVARILDLIESVRG